MDHLSNMLEKLRVQKNCSRYDVFRVIKYINDTRKLKIKSITGLNTFLKENKICYSIRVKMDNEMFIIVNDVFKENDDFMKKYYAVELASHSEK